jgi:hypothetical protein
MNASPDETLNPQAVEGENYWNYGGIL